MPRNTAIVVLILAIAAGALVLINGFGKAKPKTSSANPASPTPTSQIKLLEYDDPTCGIALSYPETLNVLDGPSGSAIFTDKNNAKNVIMVTCQKDIPRPALAADKTESLTSGTVSGTIYHDASGKDGTPIDKLIFTHPGNGLDIFISGFGADFQKVIGNINLLQ